MHSWLFSQFVLHCVLLSDTESRGTILCPIFTLHKSTKSPLQHENVGRLFFTQIGLLSELVMCWRKVSQSLYFLAVLPCLASKLNWLKVSCRPPGTLQVLRGKASNFDLHFRIKNWKVLTLIMFIRSQLFCSQRQHMIEETIKNLTLIILKVHILC